MACACAACGNHTDETHSGQEHEGALWNNHDTIRFGIAVLLFIAGILLELLPPMPHITIKIAGNSIDNMLPPLLFIGAWLCAGFEVIQTLLKTVGKGSIFDENFLMTFATVGAFILGEWTEGAAVMLFYNLGELLQAAAVRQSRTSIINLMDLRPEFARLYRNPAETADAGAAHHSRTHTEEHEHCCCGHDHAQLQSGADEPLVPPESVPIGTLILVKAGERVPLDGILTEGACSFDTASMTGESVPRVINAGEPVLAGFVNLDGLAVIKTTASAADTAAAKMLELVEQAQNRKAKTERLISSFARIYTPLVTAGAVVLALLPPLLLAGVYGIPLTWNAFVPWISRGLVFLVISCPCAFVISVPLGYFGGLGGAAKKGILIKGADFIDALAKTDTVVFDKTGTLTAGILTVQHIIPADGTALDRLAELAYIAEYHSGHPIAQAVKNHIRQLIGHDRVEELERYTAEIQDYTEKAGSGVKMSWQRKELAAGSALFIFGDAEQEPAAAAGLEGTKVFLSYGGAYAGCIICSDTVKPQSAQAVRELRKAGIAYIEMLTGDTQKNRRADCGSAAIRPVQQRAASA